jgi:hypothetical protein
MQSNGLFLMEFLIFDGVALAWAGWELWSLHRDKSKPKAKSGAEPPPASDETPRHPEG